MESGTQIGQLISRFWNTLTFANIVWSSLDPFDKMLMWILVLASMKLWILVLHQHYVHQKFRNLHEILQNLLFFCAVLTIFWQQNCKPNH